MKTTLIAIGAVFVASVAGAQDPVMRPKPPAAKPTWQVAPQQDQFSACFFAPEEVMAHQSLIKLQDDQRLKLAMQIAKTQEAVTSLQWQLTAEQEKLHKAVTPATVDEAATLKQVDRILAIEQEVKRAQMTLMIRVKNSLTVEQQRQLRAAQSVVWFARPGDSALYGRVRTVLGDSVAFAFRRDTIPGRVSWLRGDSLRIYRAARGC